MSRAGKQTFIGKMSTFQMDEAPGSLQGVSGVVFLISNHLPIEPEPQDLMRECLGSNLCRYHKAEERIRVRGQGLDQGSARLANRMSATIVSHNRSG